ncbi:MAG: GNAT family N-acetyltransferase [Arenicella sp.]|nr:GNAT family N-acetyltransferase [Arenicella sp.]
MFDIQIVNYESRYQSAFKQLNLEWMSRNWDLDEADMQLLDDPQTHLIDTGGVVLIALLNGVAVGTCSLSRLDEQSYELVKMCVTRRLRGQGIGKQLAEHAISSARRKGAQRIYLRTASNLTAAISLYRKLGFVELDCDANESDRCDIEMEMPLLQVH